jgi:hypothetical protein
MKRQAGFGALLLVCVGIALGATVFRTDIAQATGLDKAAQNVIVKNTPAEAVPVKEQNLDGDGNMKVHEQGTANVKVTNSSLTVASPAPVTDGAIVVGIPCPTGFNFGGSVVASALTFHLSAGVERVTLRTGNNSIAYTAVGPGLGGPADIDLALDRPISFDTIECTGSGTVAGGTVGNSP